MPIAIWTVLLGWLLGLLSALATLYVSQDLLTRRALLERRRDRLFASFVPLVAAMEGLRAVARAYADPAQRKLQPQHAEQAFENGLAAMALLTVEPEAQPSIPIMLDAVRLCTEFVAQVERMEMANRQADPDIRADFERRYAEINHAIEAAQATMRAQLQALDDAMLTRPRFATILKRDRPQH